MANPNIEVDLILKVDGVTSGVKAATSQLDKLGNAVQSTAPKVDSLTKATSKYNSIGIDFARVIQDAPFGIIGVGNNIQQLAQSFSVLGKEGDSLKTRLGSALGQIFNSGNLLILAVSAITTVLTLWKQGFFKTEEAAKSLRETLEEYRKTLDGVKKANLEGQINAQKELSNLKLLQIQAENASLSQEKRNQAVAQLQKQYPEYLKGLTDEQIKAGQVGDAYKNLTEDIIALSKAKALSAELDKKAGDLLTLRLQEEERANEIIKLRDKLQVALNNKVDAAARAAGQFTAENSDAMIIQMNIDKLVKDQLKSAEQRNKIIKEQLFIESQIVDENSKGANFVKDTGKAIDQNKEKLKQFSKGWEEYNLQQQIAAEFQDKLTFGIKDYEKSIFSALSSYNQIQSKDVKIKLDVEGFEPEQADPMPFENFLDLVAYQLDKLPELEQRVSEFAKTINDLITVNVTDAFIDLGYTIGEALATGGNVLKAIGGSLLKSFARFLGQFGEQLIAYGVAASAFGKVSLALAVPGAAVIAAPVAIAAGIALTAIAGVIGSLGSKGPGGGGGGAGGGSAAPAGSSFTGGGVGGLFEQNRDVSGEFVVRGNDLVYVLGQANNKINKG
jgi:hypothetical protein